MPGAAIIVGLVSGLVGALIGTLLTISHERAAEFRSRMFVAAEDFLRRAETVRRRARRPPEGMPQYQALELLLTAWDQLVSAAIVIELLFGKNSEAAHWAREVTSELSAGEDSLRAAAGARPDPQAAGGGNPQGTGDALERFAEAAAAQVRRHRS
ncbi:MAG TPA: hypothetical protein VLW44_15285 [Streptosporangiaceae bacterium]|nr:hypothetical protein [Streptosporangiaceae bacterium]